MKTPAFGSWVTETVRCCGLGTRNNEPKGVFTRDRQPKAAAHALRRRWREIASRTTG